MIAVDDRILDRASLDGLAAGLARTAGLSIGDDTRLAVCLADPAAFLALFFMLRDAGATVMPIHPATPHVAARRLALAGGCTALLFQDHPIERLDPDRPAEPGRLLQMSSGTTGAPKCIARGWAEIERELAAYVAAFTETAAMTPVVACPTTHSYGLICGVLAGLARGRRPVVIDAGNPKYVLRRLREIGNPVLYASPLLLHTLARLTPVGEALPAVMTSGTLLPAPWFEIIRARSRRFFQQYGCSEAGCIAVNPELERPEDLGYPLPHHDVTAGDGPDAPGEIMVTTGGATVATRDLGHLRADGMLVFRARLDDTINVAGLNVYPREVEDAAMRLEGVTDAVAFRRADRHAGERVALAFTAGPEVAEAVLRDHLAAELAPHQRPGEIIRIAAMPREANGKISRRNLAATLSPDGATTGAGAAS